MSDKPKLGFKYIFYDGSLSDANDKIREARELYGDHINLIVVPSNSEDEECQQ